MIAIGGFIHNVLLRFRFRIHERGESGASLVEYALLLALIAIVCVGALTFLGEQTNTRYSNIGSSVDVAGT